MLEIKGKINTAICYAKVVEDEAIEQIRRMCDYEFTAGSKIRIMPDVHARVTFTLISAPPFNRVVPGIFSLPLAGSSTLVSSRIRAQKKNPL